MKIHLSLIMFSIISINLFAQENLSSDYEYSISEPYKVIDGQKSYFHYGENMITIKTYKNKFYIQKFNTGTLKEVSRKEYKKDDILPDNYYPEDIIQIKDKCYYFYSSWSGKKTKHERLYYLTIDLNSGEIINEAVKIIDVEGKLAGFYSVNIGFFISYGVGKFKITPSKDSTKLLVNYRKKPKTKKDTKSKDIIGINVFDSNLNPLWQNIYKMPYTERRMDILDIAITNDAETYILTKVFKDDSNKDKKKKKDKKANYGIELFKLSKENSDIAISKINIKDVFINTIRLHESSNNQLYALGYYNKGLNDQKNGFFGKSYSENNADGAFLFKLNKNGELFDTKLVEIPLEIINQNIKKKSKKKNKKKDKEDKAELSNLKLRNITINEEDNSVVLIGEQYKVITTSYASSRGGMRTVTKYNYSNMLISKIDNQGKLLWMKKLPKRQLGLKGLGGMSFSYFFTKDNHFLVYLDNVKNKDLPIDKVPALHTDGSGGYLTVYKVNDNSGDVTKANILDTRHLTKKMAAHQFGTDRIIKIAEDEFLIEVYKKKKEDVIIKVKIK